MIRQLFVGILVAALSSSIPLAHASPPNETWIGGYYDDADLDNVVIAVTGAVATLTAASSNPLSLFLIAIDRVTPLRRAIVANDDFVLLVLRAPPTA